MSCSTLADTYNFCLEGSISSDELADPQQVVLYGRVWSVPALEDTPINAYSMVFVNFITNEYVSGYKNRDKYIIGIFKIIFQTFISEPNSSDYKTKIVNIRTCKIGNSFT